MGGLHEANNDEGIPRPAASTDVRRLVRVALPVPLGQSFTYTVPDTLAYVRPGARVAVEFGRRRCLGVALELTEDLPTGVAPERIKPLLGVLDREPALPGELLSFLTELARYYIAPMGEVLRLALPALERTLADQAQQTLGKKVRGVGQLVQVASALPAGQKTEGLPPAGRAAEVLALLEAEGPLELADLDVRIQSGRQAVKRLQLLGFVNVEKQPRRRDPYFQGPVLRDQPKTLNPGQARASDAITEALDARKGASFLLDGVTASGKTEVYLTAAAHARAQGRSVIVLVPEIALTPQLVGRFRARLGDEIAVLHSALSEQARLDMWRRLKQGQLGVVIGARSALFAPVPILGLICVDEEHDPSFKQEEGVRYSARDMALLRAHRSGAVCVLGSATPSLASELAVRTGKMHRLRLPERAHSAAVLPSVELIDLRRYGPGPSGDALLSLPLHRALEKNLADKGQSILFLNRRGFAPSLLCADCGHIATCPHCSVALTVHKRRGIHLCCHYCDHQRPVSGHCSACSSARLIEEGAGTERIEELVQASFPAARVARLDRDVAGGLRSEQVLSKMRKGEIDILVGTQMVTKGHDLPEVTLVGVLNADSALSLPDFRAAERTFHLLVQVAGRAGRADRVGRVLIQTRCPEHPAIVAAAAHDVAGFLAHEMRQRKELAYPPYSRAALVRFDAVDEAEALREARRLTAVATSAAPDVDALGPAPAPLARLRNRYRFQLFLRAAKREPLRRALLAVARSAPKGKVRVSIDVDPVSML
jgi:primosomal protein N' (replication factor Y)